jgi:hypothetical protein
MMAACRTRRSFRSRSRSLAVSPVTSKIPRPNSRPLRGEQAVVQPGGHFGFQCFRVCSRLRINSRAALRQSPARDSTVASVYCLGHAVPGYERQPDRVPARRTFTRSGHGHKRHGFEPMQTCRRKSLPAPRPTHNADPRLATILPLSIVAFDFLVRSVGQARPSQPQQTRTRGDPRCFTKPPPALLPLRLNQSRFASSAVASRSQFTQLLKIIKGACQPVRKYAKVH